MEPDGVKNVAFATKILQALLDNNSDSIDHLFTLSDIEKKIDGFDEMKKEQLNALDQARLTMFAGQVER